MNNNDVVTTLIEAAEENGLVAAIHPFFTNSIKVKLPFSKKTLDTNVDDLEFSVRSSNCLKRAGIMQIRDLVNAVETGSLMTIRNLGKTSFREIQTKLLVLAYGNFSENEKKQFFLDLLERNGYAG